MKNLFFLIISLFLLVPSVYAECWISTTPNDANPVYIDIDSICKKQNGTFFNIKYSVNDSGGESVFTIYSQANKAGIIKSCTYSEYVKNKYLMNTQNAKPDVKFNTITDKSKIYNAYRVSRLSTYNLSKLRENPTNISSLLSLSKQKKVSSSDEPDFGPYMRDLQQRIKLNWTPPKGNESKKVILLFKIDKDGNLLSCKVYKTSGLQDVDEAAIRAVKLTAPFRALPVQFKGNSVDIQFTFDYKVFGGSSR